MAWDFSADAEYATQLKWAEEFRPGGVRASRLRDP